MKRQPPPVNVVAEERPIIADPFEATRRRTARLVLAIAIGLGSFAAWHYSRLGLTLTHYDARSHLVVARRVVDSLTPGWRQLGAMWLPLPHLLNLVPVQWTWNFRTGFSAIAIGIGVLAWGLSCLSQYIFRHTRSAAVAIAVPLLVLANPSVLYLQSTPMTEPLLFGLSFAALWAVDQWIESPVRSTARMAGVVLAALFLTRYEGWIIGGALIALGLTAARDRRTAAPILLLPATAIVLFLALSFFSSGVLIVTSGFYTPDNPARGAFSRAFEQVLTAARELTGPVVIGAGVVGAVLMLARAVRSRGRSLLPLSLFGAALLPIAAFHAGHPERVRYMVTVAVAFAASAGLAFSLLPSLVQSMGAIALLIAALVARPPFSAGGPMLAEAQWEVPFHVARRTVTTYLASNYDGTPILASMGSLAHYMQETAADIGLPLRAFLHEGNGDLWTAAIARPNHHVQWILIEEQALGGDQLALRARQDPSFLAGFTRVSAAGGLALYRRQP
jgi:hypothetical protein